MCRLALVIGLSVCGTCFSADYSAAARRGDRYFNAYILKAVSKLYASYRLMGYDIHSVLTHNIRYDGYGVIQATNPPLTMCVAAQMEVMLTAYQIYAAETGDSSVYDYLPIDSYEGLDREDLKGHIWVNSEFNSYGTADALVNFGMGEHIPFEKLTPGAFVNINRVNGTGHAVAFLGYINKRGEMQKEYNSAVVGFKYFSSQGKKDAGLGGFDYRYAVFDSFGCPEMPGKRDCGVIYSKDQKMLNTGVMLAPRNWRHPPARSGPRLPPRSTVLNEKFFNGLTTDDE
ncbi:MAG: hypothetical protein WC421_00095 [Elusimicrobiales bacterium]